LAHLNKNGSPDAAGNINMANLLNDGWTGAAAGPWSKSGSVDADYYYVQITRWTGSASNFPFINSTGYVKQLPAFAFNRPFSPLVANVLDDLTTQGKYARRIVQCTTTNNPTFTRGLVAKNVIDMNGKNVFTDSFDSSIPAYNTSGRWDPNKALAHGDIASNGTWVNVANATVKGNVSTGPSGNASLLNGTVGDAAFVSDPSNSGKIQAGHFHDDMNVEFPDVPLPLGSSGWTGLPSPNPQTIDGVSYKYVLNGGNYLINGSDTLSDKSMYISGNVSIRVDTRINLTGQDVIQVGPNANLKLYANCADVTVSGNGILNGGVATEFSLFGTPLCTSIALGGNSVFTGVIYAPNAALDLNGGGGSPNDFSGAAMVKSAKFNGHYKFHYDEALPKSPWWRGFTVTSWNER